AVLGGAEAREVIAAERDGERGERGVGEAVPESVGAARQCSRQNAGRERVALRATEAEQDFGDRAVAVGEECHRTLLRGETGRCNPGPRGGWPSREQRGQGRWCDRGHG